MPQERRHERYQGLTGDRFWIRWDPKFGRSTDVWQFSSLFSVYSAEAWSPECLHEPEPLYRFKVIVPGPLLDQYGQGLYDIGIQAGLLHIKRELDKPHQDRSVRDLKSPYHFLSHHDKRLLADGQLKKMHEDTAILKARQSYLHFRFLGMLNQRKLNRDDSPISLETLCRELWTEPEQLEAEAPGLRERAYIEYASEFEGLAASAKRFELTGDGEDYLAWLRETRPWEQPPPKEPLGFGPSV